MLIVLMVVMGNIQMNFVGQTDDFPVLSDFVQMDKNQVNIRRPTQ